MMLTKVKFAKLDERAILPKRKNPADAGIDFFTPYDIVLEPGDMKIIRTYITVEIPEGYMLLLKPKGRSRHLVGSGVVDAYYHPGEILVRIANPTKERIILKRGDGIAQGIFIPIATPELVEVDVEELSKKVNERSGKGYIQLELFPNGE